MVRLAVREDGTRISELFEEAKEKFVLDKTFQWQGTYPTINNFYYDLDKSIVIVSIRDEIVVGVCTIQFEIDINYLKIVGAWLNDEKYASIHRIAVDNRYYHQGIASELFTEAERIIKENNVYNIRIDTYEYNHDMRNLIKKFNYVECGKIYLLRDDVYIKERIAYQKDLRR